MASLATRSGLLLLLSAAGCGLVSFDVDQTIPEQTVQGSPIGALLPANLVDIPLNIDIESQTKSRGTGPASSAHLKEVTFTMTAPPGATFEFLDTVTVRIAASGLPEVVVGQIADVPARGSFSLDVVSSVDLLPYAKAGAVLRAQATGRLPTQTVRFGGKVVIEVKVI